MQRACDVSFCMREAHVHMPRRVPLLWALLGSVGLHLALLADPPESWLESARQALAQPEDASSGELPLATQLLDMQEGAVAAALSARAQPSAALQVDWYRPPPPVPVPVSSAAPPAESGMPGPAGGMATETASPPADGHDKAGAVVAADEGQEVSVLPQSPDAPPLLPDVSALGQGKEGQGKEGQGKEGQGKEGPERIMAELAPATAVVASSEPLSSESPRALAQAGSQAGADGPPHESPQQRQVQEAGGEWQMPVQGRLHFSVSRGEGGFVVGRAQHRWQHDGQRYTLESVTETTGLAALIHPSRVVWRSSGRISSQGLRPEHFVVEKNGREMDIADLDWERMQLRLSGRNQRELSLQPMTQDLLSMFYQLAHQLPEILRNREVMQVTNGRKLERYRFQLRGQEALQLKPVGKVTTVHVQVQAAEQLIDIWLAPTLAGLPVRIRYADGKGESFDQLLDELDVAAMPGAGPR